MSLDDHAHPRPKKVTTELASKWRVLLLLLQGAASPFSTPARLAFPYTTALLLITALMNLAAITSYTVSFASSY